MPQRENWDRGYGPPDLCAARNLPVRRSIIQTCSFSLTRCGQSSIQPPSCRAVNPIAERGLVLRLAPE